MTTNKSLGLFGILAALATASCGGSVDIEFIGDGSEPAAVCGDGDVDEEEACDDGNEDSGDGCSDSCTIESSWACSGEPSDCKQTVGDGKIDEGEECDDGNLNDGDGCSSTGQIEGSCQTPLAIELEPDGDGVLKGQVEASTAGGGSQVPSGMCGSEEVGGAFDRVYELVLPAAVDLRVTVEAAFNPLIRLLEKPCDLESALACENSGGVGAPETLLRPSTPAGTYYLVVDGVNSNATGDFTLRVEGLCPVENVKLDAVNFTRRRIGLLNHSGDCAVDLSRVGFASEDAFSSQKHDLPARKLGPGKKFVMASWLPADPEYDDYIVPTGIVGSYNAGAYYLCRGSCNLETGRNVTDALVVGYDNGFSEPPTPPSEVSFSPEPAVEFPTDTNSSFTLAFPTYRRRKVGGSYPKFLASDWTSDWVLDPEIDTFSWYNRVGGFSESTFAYVTDDDLDVALEVAKVSGTGVVGFDIAIPAGLRQPKSILMRHKRTASASGHCYIYFGSETTPDAMAYQWYNGGTLYVNGDVNSSMASPLNEVRVVEFRNIDWDAHTFDLYFDGMLETEDFAMDDQIVPSGNGISNVRLGTFTAGSSCLIDRIEMR